MYKKEELIELEKKICIKAFSGIDTFNHLSYCGDIPELFYRSSGIHESCYCVCCFGI